MSTQADVVKTWEVRISVASCVYSNGHWYHADGSPFVSEFRGTFADVRRHMPALDSKFGDGKVMQWEFAPKD